MTIQNALRLDLKKFKAQSEKKDIDSVTKEAKIQSENYEVTASIIGKTAETFMGFVISIRNPQQRNRIDLRKIHPSAAPARSGDLAGTARGELLTSVSQLFANNELTPEGKVAIIDCQFVSVRTHGDQRMICHSYRVKRKSALTVR